MLNPLARDLDHVLAHTTGVWEELRGSDIFITGGTGFFGCWLLESFLWANEKLELGASATVLTRDKAAFREKAPHLANHPAIRLHAGDVVSFPFPAGRFSHVIHAATAASASLNQSQPLAMLDTIVRGTRRALDFAVASGARKFLLTSSGAVYGKQPAEIGRVPETYAGAAETMDANSAYGEGKRMAELLCAIYRKSFGIETKIARGFAFAGPYMQLDAHFAIGNFIRDAMTGRPIEVKGDGTSRRSYLYAADLVIWLWTILTRGEAGRPYNAGSEEEVSIGELAAEVGLELAPDSPVQIAGSATPGRRAESYVPCTARARTELGLRQYVPLREAIRRTAEWHERPLRPCPICEAPYAERLHRQDFALAGDHPLARGYDVVACRTCGFVYADTAVPQSTYDAFYKSLSRYEDGQASTGGGESAWDAERLSRAAARIAGLLPSRDARVLDIGCANGGLLDALRRLGYCHVSGIDPAPGCVRNAKRRGIEAYAGSLSSIPTVPGPIDCIVLSHVLEHVQDLRAAMTNLRPLVTEHTVIYVEVPDATRYADFLHSPYQDFNTEHINHFSCTALHNLFRTMGYTRREMERIVIPASAEADYPALWGAFEIRQKAAGQETPEYDGGLPRSIRRYIEASRNLMSGLDRSLRANLDGATEVILWGTGQLATKLLDQTCLKKAHVVAAVDGNAIHRGKSFAGVPILSPEQVMGMNYPIVICTLLHGREIREKIQALGLPNRIITLGARESDPAAAAMEAVL